MKSKKTTTREQEIRVANLTSTFVHLRHDARAVAVPVTKTFWPELTSGKRRDLEGGRLAMSFSFTQDWDSWERHPEGEELVVLVSGAASFLCEMPGGTEEVALTSPGDFVLVPKGAWHTAHTSVPTTMLFVTAGAGTEHRPL